MSHNSSMESWYEDESYCEGHCGFCNECDDAFYQACDEQYEEDRDNN